MSSAVIVPSAPAFLDPLIDLDTCYYYAVPSFFSFHHPNTRWLIAMIKTQEEDRVKRKMELSPELFKGRYFQMMDYPRLYMPHDPSLTPMFKRQSVLYLTTLGMALYLRSLPLVDLILFHKDPYDQVIGNPMEPQFASHLQDLQYGDFHAFPPCIVMLRMYCFESAVSLLTAGWNPTLPLALPMRRKFERRAFYFHDWLEAALGLLSERPLYPLQSLLLNMTRNMTIYKFLQLPITHLLPPTPKHRVLTGLIDVEELPVGTRMMGVRSLLEMAEDYDRYLQMRSCAVEVAALKREAVAVGLNPEILMIQAQDFDGYVADKEAAQENESNAWRGGGIGTASVPGRHWAIGPDTRLAVNANNSATDAAAAAAANTNVSAGKKKKKVDYASEGCRVMYFAMEKDKSCKRMQVCLDTIIVMCKRNFYVNGERLTAESPRSRDIRNIVVQILNMIQREQEKLDIIFAKIQSGYKKFQHVEEHKLLENRRLAAIANMSKMIATLTRILLQSKELVYFVGADFPPFPANTVDFKVNYRLQTKFNEIKGGVVQEFNSIKDGWTYLSKEMMEEVAKIKAMQLHFRVGKQPSPQAILEAKKAARKSAVRNKPANKSNMSNTNSCFVTFKKVQRVSRRGGGGFSGGYGGYGSRAGDSASPTLTAAAADAAADSPETDDRSSGQFNSVASALFDFDCEDPAADDDPLVDFHEQQRQLLKCPAQPVASEPTTPPPPPPQTAGGAADEDPRLLEDIVEECDGLSETGLLMSSLCKEVQNLLRPQRELEVKDKDDVATIEPEPASLGHGGGSNSSSSGLCPDGLPIRANHALDRLLSGDDL